MSSRLKSRIVRSPSSRQRPQVARGTESSGLAPRSFLKALTGNQGRQEKYTRLSGSQRQGVMKQRCASLAALPRRQKSARSSPASTVTMRKSSLPGVRSVKLGTSRSTRYISPPRIL